MKRSEQKMASFQIRHSLGITVRVDQDSMRELDRIALFEHDKVAPLCRRILIEKIQVYERNPAFKRWSKQQELLLEKAKKKQF